ncbi:MAG: prepilin peptidase [Eubacterium sp.]|nr:prepilin peptidase [Eubacterium sp.]
MDIITISIIGARIIIEMIMFAIGASVFSFLNVIIYRLPRKMILVKDRSRCTSCGHQLSFMDMIPIISWVSLKGRCRYCKEKVSFRYTFVECLGGISAVISTLYAGIKLKALGIFIITGILTVAIFIAIDKLRGVG